jgi:hypothetical protein
MPLLYNKKKGGITKTCRESMMISDKNPELSVATGAQSGLKSLPTYKISAGKPVSKSLFFIRKQARCLHAIFA